MLFTISVTFLYKTGPIQWMFSQHTVDDHCTPVAWQWLFGNDAKIQFYRCWYEKATGRTVRLPVIRDATVLKWRHYDIILICIQFLEMHICTGNLTIIGSYNGLSPERQQAIIWNNAMLLSIEPLGTNFTKIDFQIQTFSFKKMLLKMSSGKWRPFHLGLNVLPHLLEK